MYTVKYRQPGQIFWRKIKNVRGDGVEHSFRFFHTEDDKIFFISQQAEVVFMPERQKEISQKMSREVGQNIVRA